MKATPNTASIKTEAQGLKNAVDLELTRKPDLPESWVERLDSMGIELELLLSFIQDLEKGPDEPIKRSYVY